MVHDFTAVGLEATMLGNFDKAVAFTYIDEKGNDDDPDDAGGRTSDGIL